MSNDAPAPMASPMLSDSSSSILPGSLRVCLTTEEGVDTLMLRIGYGWTSKVQERYEVFALERGQKSDAQVTSPYKGAAVYSTLRWPRNSTVRVRFLNGDAGLRNRTMQIAAEWSQYASVNLVQSLAPDAEVRVTFTDDNTSRSRVGRAAPERYVDQTKPTMWLGRMSVTTPPDTFSSIVLHEFGHALGLIHEHQHPLSPLAWNEALTIRYFKETYNWDEADVRRFVFARQSNVETGRYDSLSIMHYPFPARLTYSGRGAPFNHKLSRDDKAFIGRIYP